MPARVDEDAIRAALEAEDANPRDIADTLAEMKARKVAETHPAGPGPRLRSGACLQRPDLRQARTDPAQARAQLQTLRGQTHQLLSALVLYR